MWFALLFTVFGMIVGILTTVMVYCIVEYCYRARGTSVASARAAPSDSSDDDSDLFGASDGYRVDVAESACNNGDPEREGCRRRIMSPKEAVELDTMIREGRIPPTGGPPIQHRQARYPDHQQPYTSWGGP